MRLAGPALRLLVTIVQIAALLAFALAAPAAHAHPAPLSQSHAQSHDCAGHHDSVAQAVAAGTDGAVTAAPEAGQAAQDGAPACCVHSCCHHVFAAAPDGPVQPLRWASAARLMPEPAAARAGVTPEAFPKPPRSRA